MVYNVCELPSTVTAMVTVRVMVAHRPIFPERADFGDLARMVTATPRAVPPHAMSGDHVGK